MKTYGEILEILKSNGDLYVPVFYITGTYEWFKVDKDHYIDQITNPYICNTPFPCFIEVESDGEIFMHPMVANKYKEVIKTEIQ